MNNERLLEIAFMGSSYMILDELRSYRKPIIKEKKMDLAPEFPPGSISPMADETLKSLKKTLEKYIDAIGNAKSDKDAQEIVNKFFTLYHSHEGLQAWKTGGQSWREKRPYTADEAAQQPGGGKGGDDTFPSEGLKIDFDVIGLLESLKKEISARDSEIGSLTEKVGLLESKNKDIENNETKKRPILPKRILTDLLRKAGISNHVED